MELNIIVNTSTIQIATPFPYTTSFYANRIKFGVLLTLQFISILCFLYVFYQFCRHRRLYQSLSHHIIFLLLIISFLFIIIAVPLSSAYLYTSYVYPVSNIFCHFWNWIHYSLNITNLFLMAFASLEQNWLIFHRSLFQNQTGKILFHFSPILCCLLYPTVFYFIVIFLYPCKQWYNFTQLLCRWPCFYRSKFLTQFDLYFNNYTPLIAIPVLCIIVYVRVFIQIRSLKLKAFKWKQNKEMILQLWAISSLYLGMWMPLQLLGIINLYFDTYFLYQTQVDYVFLFPYLIHIIYPFIVLITHYNKMINGKRNVVVPQRVIR